MTDTTNEQPPSTKRDCVLPPLRVTSSELAAIKERARDAKLSTSEFQRRACLDGKVVVRDASVDVEATRQLLAIGRNLNQLTKSAHINKIVDEAALRRVLDRIESTVMELLK